MKNGSGIILKLIISFVLIIVVAGGVFAATQTFTSSPGVAIPDATGGSSLCAADNVRGSVSNNVNVTLDGVVTNITVNLNISHTYVGDLIVDLTSPSGTTVRIVDKIGVSGGSTCGCSADDIVSNLSDSGGASIEASCGSQASGGTFLPANPLSAFIGESATGTWTLTVMDDDELSTGTLNSWSLTITTDADGTGSDTGEPQRFQFTDNRLNRFDTAAPIAVYPVDIDDESGLNIYGIDSNSDGEFLLQVTPDEIANVDDMPAENTLIDASNGVQVWRLSSGEFQILAPQYNGKQYILIFDIIGSIVPYESYEQ